MDRQVGTTTYVWDMPWFGISLVWISNQQSVVVIEIFESEKREREKKDRIINGIPY